MQFTGGSRGGPKGSSELAVHLIGLADQDQSDGDGHHDDQGTRHETVEEIREGGGHSATKGRAILGAVILSLGCWPQAVEVCDSSARTAAIAEQLGDRPAFGGLDPVVSVSDRAQLVSPNEP